MTVTAAVRNDNELKDNENLQRQLRVPVLIATTDMDVVFIKDKWKKLTYIYSFAVFYSVTIYSSQNHVKQHFIGS